MKWVNVRWTSYSMVLEGDPFWTETGADFDSGTSYTNVIKMWWVIGKRTVQDIISL